MTNEQRGATPEEWFHFDFVLGLGANLLPCVPASPHVHVAAGSALQGKVGKIPSQFNASGEAHGLLNWQKREILSNEVKMWAKDGRYNVCVRLGPISGVYALDVDIDDERAIEIGNLVYPFFASTTTPLFYRGRDGGSRKFLVPFYMEEPCKKRKIYLNPDRKGAAIELLADGQQFVAAGTHSSGSLYRWQPELPTHLPVLTLEQVNQMWLLLTSRYATASTPPQPTAGAQTKLSSESVNSDTPSRPETSSPSKDSETSSQLRTEIPDSNGQISLRRFVFYWTRWRTMTRGRKLGTRFSVYKHREMHTGSGLTSAAKLSATKPVRPKRGGKRTGARTVGPISVISSPSRALRVGDTLQIQQFLPLLNSTYRSWKDRPWTKTFLVTVTQDCQKHLAAIEKRIRASQPVDPADLSAPIQAKVLYSRPHPTSRSLD